MFAILWRVLEGHEDRFETSVVCARDRDAAQRFQKGDEHRRSLRVALELQRLQRAAAQILRQLVGPQRFNNGTQFAQPRGYGAPRARVFVFEASRIIENNMASFTSRRVGSGVGKISQ